MKTGRSRGFGSGSILKSIPRNSGRQFEERASSQLTLQDSLYTAIDNYKKLKTKTYNLLR
jgi:hypothetical protein